MQVLRDSEPPTINPTQTVEGQAESSKTEFLLQDSLATISLKHQDHETSSSFVLQGTRQIKNKPLTLEKSAILSILQWNPGGKNVRDFV